MEHTIRTFAEPIFATAGVSAESVSITLVDDPSLNAFVAGGQNMFFHTGLLTSVEEVGQLVGVLAHETGHIAGGHLVRLEGARDDISQQALIAGLLGLAAGIAAGRPDAGAGVMMGTQASALGALLGFTRSEEASADQAALSYLDANQLSARGLMNFLKKLEDQELLPEGKDSAYWRTHPLSRERVQAVRAHVDRSRWSDKPYPA
ncbi:MAG TPA: M48 family metalloprotease, partial [Alphaproteobacteria bacterium]|nr:M48 family metalloprotease [Alphaproteobacteria bacterium]